MKITELKCSACNGSLTVDNNNPNIAVCDYCGTKFVLESESSGNVHLGSRTEFVGHDSQAFQRTQGTYPGTSVNRGTYSGTAGNVPRRSGNPVAAVSVVLIITTICISVAVAMNIYRGSGSSEGGSYAIYSQGNDDYEEEEQKLGGLLAVFAGKVMEKPADTITGEELAKFTWISVTGSGETLTIGYSFADPDAEDTELSWVSLSSEEGESTNMDSLPLFSGLKKFETTSHVSADMLAGLSLESLTCYEHSLQDIAEMLDDPSLIREINLTGSPENLDGLDQFPELAKLMFRAGKISDISSLATLKSLKDLVIESGDSIGDFSVLYVMTGLESLSVDSESIKDIGFIRDMPELQSLSLIDNNLLNLNALEGKDQLQSLMIKSCDELIDSSGVSGLTGLRHLYLELPYKCPDPDLSGLTELETLMITRMDTVQFLRNMSKLEVLQMQYCDIDDSSAFEGLASLKSFSCSSLGYDTGWDFITRIPALEVIKLNSMATYKDVSMLFNIPTLREIYLNGMECELNFASLQRNESLEIIEMDGVKLYKNVKISGGGGITYVDYDKVTLDEHTGFLANYPNLKQLSLADNKLTGIAFAAELLYLEQIDINSNYITDLKPLEGLDYLSTVYCSGNPVENYRVLADEVIIVK